MRNLLTLYSNFGGGRCLTIIGTEGSASKARTRKQEAVGRSHYGAPSHLRRRLDFAPVETHRDPEHVVVT